MKNTSLIVTALIIFNACFVELSAAQYNSTYTRLTSEFKWAFEENGSNSSLSYDGAWNYSQSTWDEVASLVPGNEWNDIKTSLTEAYEGQSSIEINFNHMNGGYINLSLSTSPTGEGVEPGTQEEKDAAKDISGYNVLRFFIKRGSWTGNGTPELQIDLIETPFTNSNYVRLSNYLQDWNFDNWVEVRIPLADLMAPTTDLTRIKEIRFRFTPDFYAQSGVLYMDNVGFIHVEEQGQNMPDTRNWFLTDTNDNGEYNYSSTTMSGGSTVNTSNQWGDAVVCVVNTGAYGGSQVTAVDLYFSHNGQGYAEANLTTSATNTGVEPVDFVDRFEGKAISNNSTFLRFTLYPVSYTDSRNIKIKLKDALGHESAMVLMAHYISTYGRYGFSVNVPTYLFSKAGFDFNQVTDITFFVDSGLKVGVYAAKIGNIKFVRNSVNLNITKAVLAQPLTK